MQPINKNVKESNQLEVTTTTEEASAVALAARITSLEDPCNLHLDMEVEITLERLQIVQERRRQAELSFNLALIATAACALIGLLGAGLLLLGKAEEGSVILASGSASSVCYLRFAKDANDRLDRISAELKDES